MTDLTAFTERLSVTLGALADANRARPMQAYMKQHFAFLGIPTPQRRKAIAPLLRELQGESGDTLLVIAKELWAKPEREFQYAAIDLLARHWKKLEARHLEALLDLARHKSWWDSVDNLAGVIGNLVQRERSLQSRMDQALQDTDFWQRRIAMIHQLGWRDTTDTERLFAYARQLAPEQEFFIRKAIGWALRDYAKHQPKRVADFLIAMKNQLSPLSLREAGKHLPISYDSA